MKYSPRRGCQAAVAEARGAGFGFPLSRKGRKGFEFALSRGPTERFNSISSAGAGLFLDTGLIWASTSKKKRKVMLAFFF
jgi:hypothetical protein